MSIPSAVASPLRPAFPDAPLSPVPQLYDDEVEPDVFMYGRAECDFCFAQLEDTYPRVVTKSRVGEIDVLCPACFWRKYGYRWLHFSGYALARELVYVLVRHDCKYYRWEAPE